MMPLASINTFIRQAVLVSLVIAFPCLSGCSDEGQTEKTSNAGAEQTTTSSNSSEPSVFDHPHGAEVTDMEKHKFEHDFAEQCVAREIKSSSNPDEDKARLGKTCECIATYMMKDLTAKEAEKFIKKHEQPQSLAIKYDAASYHCLQEKTQTAGPKLSGKPTDNTLE